MLSEYDRLIRADFKNLLSVIWEFQGLPEPSALQYDIADYIQHGHELSLTRNQVHAMRGAAKSFMGCAYVCWYLLRNPNAEVLVISKSEGKAKDFSSLIRAWINGIPELAALRPRKGARDNVLKFDVGCREIESHSASVTIAGITSQVTGGRAHLIISDDIETPDNSATLIQREKLLHKVTEFESIIHQQVEGEDPRKILYLGTPHSEESIYNHLHTDRGYLIRSWPAEYPPDEPCYRRYLSPWMADRLDRGEVEIGDPSFPERYSKEELMLRQAKMGKATYDMQFMLNTERSDENRYPLKVADLIVLDTEENRCPANITWTNSPNRRFLDRTNKPVDVRSLGRDCFYEPLEVSEYSLPVDVTVMAIDPSGRGKDETGWTVGRLCNGRIFIVAAGGFQEGLSESKTREMVAKGHRYGVQLYLTESNYGGGMYTELLKPVVQDVYKELNQKFNLNHQAGVEEKRVSGMKEHRICDVLEPLFNQHRIVVSKDVATQMGPTLHHDLWYQVTHMRRERDCVPHDDRVDSLTLLCEHFAAAMAVDHKMGEKRAQHEDYMAWVEEVAQMSKRAGNVGTPKPRPWRRSLLSWGRGKP